MYLVVGKWSDPKDYRVLIAPYDKHWTESIYYETDSLITAIKKAHRLTNYCLHYPQYHLEKYQQKLRDKALS